MISMVILGSRQAHPTQALNGESHLSTLPGLREETRLTHSPYFSVVLVMLSLDNNQDQRTAVSMARYPISTQPVR